MAKAERKMLGDLLVEYRIITREQLQEALTIQKKTGERLGKVLTKSKIVSQQQINEILEFQLGIPQVSLLKFSTDPEVIRLIPESICRQHKCLALKRNEKRLTVAMADPLNVIAMDDVKMATKLDVDPVIATEEDIESILNQVYGMGASRGAAVRVLEAAAGGSNDMPGSMSELDMLDLDRMDAGADAPVVRVVNMILQQAVQDRASDIHIEINEQNIKVRYRVDGMLREMMTIAKHAHASLMSRIKLLAEMDIAEKRVPQDGRIQIKLDKKPIDLRVSTLPTIFGEKCVIRLLDKANMFYKLEDLHFREDPLKMYRKLIRNAFGIVLVTGPTGSGKTTTLYATIADINSSEKNIVTIEDPVEYVLPGINQVQVNVKAGVTFASGLRSILRQDPDVILVGEIRDGDTADIAVRAATTGHLVFSTLHTNDAAGAIARLIDMGVEPFLVGSSLTGVLAQRLVRKICPHCKESYEPEPGSAERLFLSLDREASAVLHRGKGCFACNYTGYKGRLPIQEVMPVTSHVREQILAKAATDTVRSAAIRNGMYTMRDDGIEKVMQGLTTVQEIMRVAYTTE
ncbi:GspE/PulE family protein [Heliophilum fasciatum]|uniref:Type II secretion system protein E (GspE) n=1 Tax=Heliophilum fasciatum TaxID=35700 RepID=A0A4R2RWI9_9FIRM|nr:GspE/PulE family protein [Heliophilum fasciatum]MCW2277280.1 type IV pilus assembly protein PilB [Heliophilum fasciatum]TCP67117.1 type II secretion system protein E (GspE) [Heliophilum fasciatum]